MAKTCILFCQVKKFALAPIHVFFKHNQIDCKLPIAEDSRVQDLFRGSSFPKYQGANATLNSHFCLPATSSGGDLLELLFEQLPEQQLLVSVRWLRDGQYLHPGSPGKTAWLRGSPFSLCCPSPAVHIPTSALLQDFVGLHFKWVYKKCSKFALAFSCHLPAFRRAAQEHCRISLNSHLQAASPSHKALFFFMSFIPFLFKADAFSLRVVHPCVIYETLGILCQFYHQKFSEAELSLNFSMEAARQ